MAERLTLYFLMNFDLYMMVLGHHGHHFLSLLLIRLRLYEASTSPCEYAVTMETIPYRNNH